MFSPNLKKDLRSIVSKNDDVFDAVVYYCKHHKLPIENSDFQQREKDLFLNKN